MGKLPTDIREEIERLRGIGWTDGQISRKLHLPYGTVYNTNPRAIAMRQSNPPYVPDEEIVISVIRPLLDNHEGMTHYQLARIFGRRDVHAELREAGRHGLITYHCVYRGNHQGNNAVYTLTEDGVQRLSIY